jgi:dCMP deaminase
MLASRAYKIVTKPEVLHAESNAITKLAKSTQSSKDSTLYTTASPCVDCAKLIIQSDICRVVYGELYKNSDGIDLLKKAKIQVEHCAI